MGHAISNIEQFFRSKSILSVLIAVNVAAYLLILLIGIVSALFNIDGNFLLENLQLPADLSKLLYKPWTLVTYMFSHASFWHILFNLLWLYWFGQLFVHFFGPKSLGSLYFLGGIGGALFFIASYNLFPYFQNVISSTVLIGASASIMAVVFAVAFYRPNFEIRLFLLGNVKIIYIALMLLLINIINLQTTGQGGEIILNNAGGFFAHLGGIMIGIWYAFSYNKGKDMTKGLNAFFDSAVNLFKKKPRKRMKVKYKRPETDREYNARKHSEQEEIDRILDKIKHSGYNTLSDDEKNKLFNAGKK